MQPAGGFNSLLFRPVIGDDPRSNIVDVVSHHTDVS